MRHAVRDTVPPYAVDQRNRLHQVSWALYDRMVEERGESAAVRFSYLDGELELMTPSIHHENYKKAMARLLEAYAEELGIDLEGYGSWALKREPDKAGLEPD